MLRFLFRLLMNERLIEKLSESYPIRRAAKWVVYIVQKSKAIQEEKGGKLSDGSFKGLTQKISSALKDVRNNLEKHSKK